MENIKNLRKVGVIAALAISFSACTKQDPGTWGGLGVGERAIERTSATCRAQASKYVNQEIGMQLGNENFIQPQDARTVAGVFLRLDLDKIFQRVFVNCMQAAGYSREQE